MFPWLFITGISGAVAVLAGAYGWHWIEYSDAAMKDIFNVGVQYHMWHTLVLPAVAWLSTRSDVPRLAVRVAGWGFAIGMVLFSGTLYYMGLTGDVLVKGAAPVGGFFLIAGWLALSWAGIAACRAAKCATSE